MNPSRSHLFYTELLVIYGMRSGFLNDCPPDSTFHKETSDFPINYRLQKNHTSVSLPLERKSPLRPGIEQGSFIWKLGVLAPCYLNNTWFDLESPSYIGQMLHSWAAGRNLPLNCNFLSRNTITHRLMCNSW